METILYNLYFFSTGWMQKLYMEVGPLLKGQTLHFQKLQGSLYHVICLWPASVLYNHIDLPYIQTKNTSEAIINDAINASCCSIPVQYTNTILNFPKLSKLLHKCRDEKQTVVNVHGLQTQKQGKHRQMACIWDQDEVGLRSHCAQL